jgi:glutamate/tyrosine decarboxylase-like PLP-dependent enzyme
MSSLDPSDWTSLRAIGHQMMDDMIDHLAGLRCQPVWQTMPQTVRAGFQAPLPQDPAPVKAVYGRFRQDIQPYVTGNTHPRFFGWVHGGGNAVSMLAEFLAGAMNANCGGRDHAGLVVERQVIAWGAEMLGMPDTTSGVLLTGSSMANFVALLCARYRALGPEVRTRGLQGKALTAYAVAGAHRCIAGAMDMAGIGREALRLIPVNTDGQMDLGLLAAAIADDNARGRKPFLIVGTAGSVDTGAIDDLTGLRGVADAHALWFHVDAAFGALAALSPKFKPMLAGIETADSVAFDFHKWAQVTYDAGCILVRDGDLQLSTFSQATNYLAASPRGLTGGAPWACDLGPDLSRGFRALKIWMTLSAYGTAALGGVVETCCELAAYLGQRVLAELPLDLLAPVRLNIVCIGLPKDIDVEELVADMQEAGGFAPSTTKVNGRPAIRVAIVNHRTEQRDIDALLTDILARIDVHQAVSFDASQ